MKNQTSAFDIRWMRRALELAQRGMYTTSANPRVGCVLVKDQRVIGEGWHKGDGAEHAEVAAIANAQARGASITGVTAYVTLEPCAHHGKQPPCVEALVRAGVVRLVAALEDPNPLVSGQGFRYLRHAGIAVEEGVLAQESQAINRGFFYRHRCQRPWVTVKLAMSQDGRIAASDGSSRYISCEASRADAMRWRARSQAILTSSATVLADDPQHSVRGVSPVMQPDIWLLDSKRRVPLSARIFARVASHHCLPLTRERRIFWVRPHTTKALPEHVVLVPKLEQPMLVGLLKQMAHEGVNELLTECGGQLAGALLAAGLVNHLVIYQAPILLGHRGKPLAQLAIDTMGDRMALRLIESRSIGTDIRLVYACDNSDRPC